MQRTVAVIVRRFDIILPLDDLEQLEQGNAKLAEKGWREYRVDMLSSSAVRVTYVRGELEEDEELPLDGEEE